MAESGIEIADQDLDDALAWILGTEGVSAQFAGRDMMRVLMNNVTKMTFPATMREGRQAIDADLSKVFVSLDNPDVIGYFNQEFGDGTYTKAGKLKGKKRQAKARKQLRGVKFNWQGDQRRMQSWHDAHRRRGKVRARSHKVASVGPWDFSSEMYVPANALRKYKRKKYQSVGKNKAGWEPAATHFANVTQGRSTVPAFVRNQVRKRGTFTDAFTPDGGGYASATNLTPYASRMTRYFLKRAEMKTDAYSQNATQKQIDKIVARFNTLEGKAPPVQVVKP